MQKKSNLHTMEIATDSNRAINTMPVENSNNEINAETENNSIKSAPLIVNAINGASNENLAEPSQAATPAVEQANKEAW